MSEQLSGEQEIATQELIKVHPRNSITFSQTDHAVKLKVYNISDKLIVYKVKTTVPFDYAVKPSSGFLEKGESETVQITLQKGFNPKKRHRFMVQATIPPKDIVNRELFWRETTIFENPLQQIKINTKLPHKEHAPRLAEQEEEDVDNKLHRIFLDLKVTIVRIIDRNPLLAYAFIFLIILLLYIVFSKQGSPPKRPPPVPIIYRRE